MPRGAAIDGSPRTPLSWNGMTPGDPVYRVLLVCTGNTCRSPMAAGALLVALGGDAEQVRVESAGTAAWEGQPATEPARRGAAAGGGGPGGPPPRPGAPADGGPGGPRAG